MSKHKTGDEGESTLSPRVVLMEPQAPAFGPEVIGPRVIETAQTGRILPAPPPAPAASIPARPRASAIRKFAWGGLFAAVCGWFAIDLYLWVASAFDYGAGLGWAAAAAIATGISAAGVLIARELRSYFALKEVEANQHRLAAPETMRSTDMQHAIREVLAEIPRDRESNAAVEAFQRKVQRHHSPEQQIELLSQTVMTPLDRRAEAIVRRASGRAAGIVAISPTALTDAIFFIAASVSMVRRIAACYGHRPTALATVHLLRRLIIEAGKLGAVDLAGAALVQHIGGAVAERVALSAAESMYAAQRMARLGLVAMNMCRPVPFRKDELPGIMSSLVGKFFTRRADSRADEQGAG